MLGRPGIDTARELQTEPHLKELHVCWFDRTGYTIAHTDTERHELSNLKTCPLSRWIDHVDRMPVPTIGWYTADQDPKGVWEFTPLIVAGHSDV